jgi:hypothetical protein
MDDAEFYLTCIEGFCPEEPRRCTWTKQIAFGAFGETALLVSVDPPYSGTRYRRPGVDVHFVLLSVMFRGDSLDPVSKWPLNVSIFVPMFDGPELRDSITTNEVNKIAFGQIHQTKPS